MKQNGIYMGRTEILYNYGRFGYTRGNGKTWHGGVDVVGLDDTYVRMPYYQNDDGTLRSIAATVRRARCVTNRNNKTWEWGNYVGVLFDAGQTPDDVNYLVFAHNARLLVKEGQHVKSGDILAVMGNTGNAAGVYGATDNGSTEQISDKPTGKTMQCLMVGPLAAAAAAKCDDLARTLELVSAGRYCSLPAANSEQVKCIGAVSNGDAVKFYALAEAEGWTKAEKYVAQYVG